MNEKQVIGMTDAYLTSYMRALDKTGSKDLAAQVAIGVVFALASSPQQQRSTGGALFNVLFEGMRGFTDEEEPQE